MSEVFNYIGKKSIVRGDTKTFSLVFTDMDNVAIDITGWSLYLTIKENKTDPDDDAKLKKTLAPGDLSDPTSGIQAVTIGAGDTANMLGEYYYDFQAKTADGKVYTIIYGTMTIVEDITLRAT